ncbi:DUF3068 domain-containing protein, partial [Actinomadura fibrosa]
MRHVLGTVLTGVGAFVLVIGFLIRFYAAPRLIMAPTDAYQVTRLRAEGASYFDAKSLRLRKGATITATNTVRGDVLASHDGVAVWDSVTTVQDVARGYLIDIRTQRVAFDRRSGRLTSCCGAAVQGDVTARQDGIGLFWPVDVTRRTYQLYDVQTRRAWPVVFQGEERVEGVRAYRFVQRIPATKVTEAVPDMPGEMLGLGKKRGGVPVDRYYEAEATYWVDPRTGAPIDQRQRALSTLRAKTGPGRLVVADLDLRMSPETRRELIARSDDGAEKIRLVETAVPLACGIAGLVALAAGLAASPRG